MKIKLTLTLVLTVCMMAVLPSIGRSQATNNKTDGIYAIPKLEGSLTEHTYTAKKYRSGTVYNYKVYVSKHDWRFLNSYSLHFSIPNVSIN